MRPRPWMCCCSRPWGPGTGLSGERTSASVQAGKAVRPELPPATWTGRARHLQPFLSQQLPVLTALACEAATSPGCHPEPPPGLLGASSTGLRTVLWYKGQNSQASVTVATTTRGECGARGRGTTGSGLGHGEATMALKMEGQGDGRSNPHFMQGTAACPAALQSSGPWSLALGKLHLDPRGRQQGDGCRHPAWGESGKSATESRCFAQGSPVGRSLPSRNGSISRNSLHISFKLTRGGGGGWQGTGEGGKRGGPGGGSEQVLASPTTILLPGAGATCPLCSQACLPRSERPGTGPGRPGCS